MGVAVVRGAEAVRVGSEAWMVIPDMEGQGQGYGQGLIH